jgi:hypothetical protein
MEFDVKYVVDTFCSEQIVLLIVIEELAVTEYFPYPVSMKFELVFYLSHHSPLTAVFV